MSAWIAREIGYVEERHVSLIKQIIYWEVSFDVTG
jgi:hypothetical protein